jgi:HK97 family phage major capsid protein
MTGPPPINVTPLTATEITRTYPDRFIPQQVVNEIVSGLNTTSVVRSLARNVPLTSRTARMTVPAEPAQAYWVKGASGDPNNDLGQKQLTKFGLTDLEFVVEELACLVVIPNAYVDDAQISLWDYARTELTAAFARKIDLAFLFNLDRPASTGDSVYELAVADNLQADSADITQGLLNLLESLQDVNGIVSRSSFPYAVANQSRSALWFDPRGPAGINLFGIRAATACDGGWDDSKASALVGAWNYAMFGIRQDLTFDMFREGVITDENGAVVINLMQQDAQALRAVMRVAWAVQPQRRLKPDGTYVTQSPFGLLKPITKPLGVAGFSVEGQSAPSAQQASASGGSGGGGKSSAK